MPFWPGTLGADAKLRRRACKRNDRSVALGFLSFVKYLCCQNITPILSLFAHGACVVNGQLTVITSTSTCCFGGVIIDPPTHPTMTMDYRIYRAAGATVSGGAAPFIFMGKLAVAITAAAYVVEFVVGPLRQPKERRRWFPFRFVTLPVALPEPETPRAEGFRCVESALFPPIRLVVKSRGVMNIAAIVRTFMFMNTWFVAAEKLTFVFSACVLIAST